MKARIRGKEAWKDQILSFLCKSQNPDGSFSSSSSDGNFIWQKKVKTTFYTSLILLSLKDIRNNPKAKAIINKGVHFLLKQKSPEWSWNYLARTSLGKPKQAYPDDLDDTFLALSALSVYRPALLNGDAMASIVKLLIQNERNPGGPYETWIVPSSLKEKWADIDPGVNSNIGYFFSLRKVAMPNLIRYAEKRIKELDFKSKYYHSPYPIVYFLSRFYSGLMQKDLSAFILSRKLKNGSWGNEMDTALAISALIQCDMAEEASCAASDLKKRIEKNQFQSFPFFIEEKKEGKILYSGSRALTAALILEALLGMEEKKKERGLLLSENTGVSDTEFEIKKSIVRSVKMIFERFENAGAGAIEKIDLIVKHDARNEITLLPYRFFKSLNTSNRREIIPKETLQTLGEANLLGWLSYRIYDDILDGEARADFLPFANYALLEVGARYWRIFKKNETPLFMNMMLSMEKANEWERLHCRKKIKHELGNRKEDILLFSAIPDYKNNSVLGDKSMGHALGPVAILAKLGHEPDGEAIRNVLSFFKHYTIARQLNDDAHDWLADLKRGFINSASANILRLWIKKNATNASSLKTISLLKSTESLQSVFWIDVIPKTAGDIIKEIHLARTSLKKLKDSHILRDTSYLEGLLEPISVSAGKASRDRGDTLSFLTSYSS